MSASPFSPLCFWLTFFVSSSLPFFIFHPFLPFSLLFFPFFYSDMYPLHFISLYRFLPFSLLFFFLHSNNFVSCYSNLHIATIFHLSFSLLSSNFNPSVTFYHFSSFPFTYIPLSPATSFHPFLFPAVPFCILSFCCAAVPPSPVISLSFFFLHLHYLPRYICFPMIFSSVPSYLTFCSKCFASVIFPFSLLPSFIPSLSFCLVYSLLAWLRHGLLSLLFLSLPLLSFPLILTWLLISIPLLPSLFSSHIFTLFLSRPYLVSSLTHPSFPFGSIKLIQFV